MAAAAAVASSATPCFTMFTVSLNTEVYEAGSGNVLAFYNLLGNPAAAALFKRPKGFPESLKLKKSGSWSTEFHGCVNVLFSKSEIDKMIAAMTPAMRVHNADNGDAPPNRPYDRIIVCGGAFTPDVKIGEDNEYNLEMERDFPPEIEDQELNELMLKGNWEEVQYVRFDEDKEDDEEEDDEEDD